MQFISGILFQIIQNYCLWNLSLAHVFQILPIFNDEMFGDVQPLYWIQDYKMERSFQNGPLDLVWVVSWGIPPLTHLQLV